MTETRKRYIPYKLFRGAILPNWLMRRSEISHGAKICWARLAQYANKSGKCHPKQSTLAADLGVTKRQTQDYIAELEDADLIEIERRGKLNWYFFLKHRWEQANDCSTEQTNNSSTHKRVSRRETDEGTDDRAILANGFDDFIAVPELRGEIPKTFEEVQAYFETLCDDLDFAERVARRFIQHNNNKQWRLRAHWHKAADGFWEKVKDDAQGL